RLRPILFGGSDTWKAADRLKRQQVPVLVRLNFADQPQPRGGRRAPVVAVTPDAAPPTPEVDRAALPKRAQEDLQRQQKEEVHNAAVLHQQGVPFAFSTQGQVGDKPWDKFRDNLRKVIADGLPPEAALKALTVDAARILGVEKQLGTVERGK